MEPIKRDMELLSNSMATYAHIQANPEGFALYFMMGVCSGLLLALCLLVSSLVCRPPRKPLRSPKRRRLREPRNEGESREKKEEEEEEEEFPNVTVGLLGDRVNQSNGTLRNINVFTSAEELEMARRLEERERIVREIWRNGQPDVLATGTGTIDRVYYH